MNITLETERLVLRPYTQDNIPALFQILGDKEVNVFLPWFVLTSVEETKKFFTKNYQSAKYFYAICLKDENQPIGYIHLSEDDSYDLGYGLRKEYWRKGIVVEAGKAFIMQLKKEGIPYITVTHDVKNPHSGYVMKRLGMHYQYSYLEWWKPKNIIVRFRMYQLNFNSKEKTYLKYWKKHKIHFHEKNV